MGANTGQLRFTDARATSGKNNTPTRATWLNSRAWESASPSTRCTTGYACSPSSNLATRRGPSPLLMIRDEMIICDADVRTSDGIAEGHYQLCRQPLGLAVC